MHVHSAFKHLIALFEPMIYKTVLLSCVEILEMISDQEQEKKNIPKLVFTRNHKTTDNSDAMHSVPLKTFFGVFVFCDINNILLL